LNSSLILTQGILMRWSIFEKYVRKGQLTVIVGAEQRCFGDG
tara:strand:- start:192 stop:317 length:126 start_codon:yes stop_codon:yes gene_type:complete